MSVTIPVGESLFLVDAGFLRPGLAACYLVVDDGRAAFVETGTANSVPRLLAALAERDLDVGDVEIVAVTHVHLDHAAGAGALLEALPNARLLVHPRGARHMIDPAKLIAGAVAVYGEPFVQQSYGHIRPVPTERVTETPEGFVARLGGRALAFWDTPGHARHHVCIWDEGSRGVFTGDIFGLAYRELDSERGPFIFPTTSPVQFDPVAMHSSIDRVVAANPACVFLTHYGRIDDVADVARDLHQLIDAWVAIAERSCGDGRHTRMVDAIMSHLLERARAHGCLLEQDACRDILSMDVELDAQGLEVWLDRENE